MLVVWLFGLIFVFGVGVLLGRYGLIRHNMGEALVCDTISAGFMRPHLLLNNVTLPIEGGTTQIDHIVVADTGIFIIETKHYGGWIFGEASQKSWTQVIYKKKTRFPNPLFQNYAHVKAVQELFTLPEDSFYSFVVFTGDAEFKTDLGPNVIKLQQLLAGMVAERPVIFDERKMAYVVGRIEMKRLRRSIETDEYHVNYVRERIARKHHRNLTAIPRG